MGCFSWFTQDISHTRIVIGDVERPIYMIGEVNGQVQTYVEKDRYDGYGVFGGKDYYNFLAEMNGITLESCDGDAWVQRNKAIDLAYKGWPEKPFNPDCKYPTLTLDPKGYKLGYPPDDDPGQGFPD